MKDRILPEKPALVVDRRKKPLNPTTYDRAINLISEGQAKLCHRLPFTIRMIETQRENVKVEPLILKVTPGTQSTVLSLILIEKSLDEPLEASPEAGSPDGDTPGGAPFSEASASRETRQQVLGYYDYQHWGREFHAMMAKIEKSYRNRPKRFDSLKHPGPEDWLPPEIRHRVDAVEAMCRRIIRFAPIKALLLDGREFDPKVVALPRFPDFLFKRGVYRRLSPKNLFLERWSRKSLSCQGSAGLIEADGAGPKLEGGSGLEPSMALAAEDGS